MRRCGFEAVRRRDERTRAPREGRLLFDRGFTFGTAGNISLRGGDHVIVSPTNSSFVDLAEEDLAKMNWDGEALPGPKPSKEGPQESGLTIAQAGLKIVYALAGVVSRIVALPLAGLIGCRRRNIQRHLPHALPRCARSWQEHRAGRTALLSAQRVESAAGAQERQFRQRRVLWQSDRGYGNGIFKDCYTQDVRKSHDLKQIEVRGTAGSHCGPG